MKKCFRCHTSLLPTQSSSQTYCKPCKSLIDKGRRGSDRHKSKATRQMQTRRIQARHYVLDYWKTHPCTTCGETDPRCLQFDHLDPEQKTSTVSSMVAKGRALKAIRQEIAKCQVLCANCHAKKTSDQFRFYTSNPIYMGDF